MTTYADRARVEHLIALRRGPDAVAAAAGLLAASPEDADVMGLLARGHQLTGRLTEAVTWARRAVSAAPADPRLHVVLSDLLRRSGAHQEAAEVAYAALRLAPHDASAMTAYALALEDAGHSQEAEWAGRRVVELSPTDPHAYLNLGYVLHRIKPAEARAAYEECLRLDPSNALAMQNLGALQSRSSPSEAIDKFAASLAVDPQLEVARANLARTLNRRLWPILVVTLFTLQVIARGAGDDVGPAVVAVLTVALSIVAYTWIRLPRSVRRAWRPLLLPGLSHNRWALRTLAVGLAIALAGCAWMVRAGDDAQAPGMVVGLGAILMLFSLVGVLTAIRDEKRGNWS